MGMIEHCNSVIAELEAPPRLGFYRYTPTRQLLRWRSLRERLRWSENVKRKPLRRFICGKWDDE